LGNGTLRAKTPEVKYLIDRLASRQFFVNVPVSNWEKAGKRLLEGDFQYLWLKARTTYWKEALLLSLAGLAVLLGMVRWWRSVRRKRRGRASNAV